MTRKHTQLAVSIFAGFFLLALLILSAVNSPAPEARADTVPTPAAIMNQSESSALITFLDSYSSTDGADAGPAKIYTYEYGNFQYVIDQMGASPSVNTTTLTVQWSMDATTWSDGPAMVSANVADADSVVQVPNLGLYRRVYPDHTGTNPVTITVKAVCK